MSGTIVRANNWDVDNNQQFLAVNPLGDEVVLYRTDHDNPSGRNDIIKVNSQGEFDNIQCSAYCSYNVGLTGVGQINGSIGIFDITEPTSPVLTLRPKQSRSCNALNFNGNGLVAAGFDKGRQDHSLQIWNVEGYGKSGGDNDHKRPPANSYIPNESIMLVQFYPDKPTNLLVGSHKFLREIDIRTEVPLFQISTRCTLGISIDPFREYYFQLFAEDGSLTLWDRRKLYNASSKFKTSLSSNVMTETPILQFSKLLNDSSRKNRYPCVRHSSVRKGEFAALFNGELIRRWNTGIVPPIISDSSVKSQPRPIISDPVTTSLKQQAAQMYKPKEESMFVAFVLDAKTDGERIISFDYCPDMSSNTSLHFICMRPSGSVFQMPITEAVDCISFNSQNEFTFSGSDGTLMKQLDTGNEPIENIPPNGKLVPSVGAVMNHRPIADDSIESTMGDESELEDFNQRQRKISMSLEPKLTRRETDEYDDEFESVPLNSLLGLTDVMTNDICYVMRNRSILGYGVDCELNVKLLEKLRELSHLINIWKWFHLAKKSLQKGTMISKNLDLGFQGVYGIWMGVDEINNQHRYSKEFGPVTDRLFADVVDSIVSSKGSKGAGINIHRESDWVSQRKLALIVSGWYLADNEFVEKLDELVRLGMFEKAAGWAVFHGDVAKAVLILASSNKEVHRVMSTAVAGYLAYKDSTVNSPWKDQCRKMASELDDPYLRAIFAFIADNDWWDVLDEHSLPLKERLGVAFRFLSDKDLTVYLKRILSDVIAKGEIEGLILTGITPPGIDLLQAYVDRTSDVQTAALITSFGCPRYFTDPRVFHWVSCYRDLLNSWGMFSTRAKFDVARTKLSKTSFGQTTMQPPAKQVYLQCVRCNKNLSRPPVNNGRGFNSALMKQQFSKMSLNQPKKDIRACPHCGAALPRCSICLLSLGTPITDDTSLETATQQEKIENSFKQWFSFCLNCNHGAHALHAEEWFAKHYVCPVPDCNCRCNNT